MASAPTHQRRIVGVSMKMYFSASRMREYIDELRRHLENAEDSLSAVDIFILPDHVTLMSTINQLKGTALWCGAQDTFHQDSGAFTGMVSPAVLAEVGARIVAVGHAERRRMFMETDNVVAQKAAAVARNGMIPLVCIGERTKGPVPSAAIQECCSQIESAMATIPDDAEVILAYEPCWAIGAAEPAAVDYVITVATGIRELPCVRERTGTTRIIYGGSAGPGLFKGLNLAVDGLFLGRFGHDAGQFFKTIQEIAAA